MSYPAVNQLNLIMCFRIGLVLRVLVYIVLLSQAFQLMMTLISDD